MKANWIDRPVDEAASRALAAELGCPLPVADLLVQRGLTDPEAAQAFLAPKISSLQDPFDLPQMEAAVSVIWTAIEEGRSIVVHGDYDVDGISSTALLTLVLRAMGARAEAFIPHRVDDGYGLHPDTVKQCREQFDAGCIITVDCGTSSVEAAAYAAEHDVDLVITDHHEPGEAVADAPAVVNPKLGRDPAAALLAGVGVTFKLCHALVKIGRLEERPGMERFDLRPYLDLVALGTIADMVPLLGENRMLAAYGLRVLSQTPRPGLSSLMEKAGLKGPIDAGHVGFQLGPRLNAAGRMDSATAALELLLTEDAAEADRLAALLDCHNRDRRREEDDVLKAVLKLHDAGDLEPSDWAVVAAGADWHPGVVGIVASRLMRRFHRPSVVIAINEDGRGRGSCRSIPGFDLTEGLAACTEHLEAFGGHQMAAGLEIHSDRVEAFRKAFNAAVAGTLTEAELAPEVLLDGWLELGDIREELFNAVQPMQPFGMGNPEPVWGIRNLTVKEHRVLKDKHLKVVLSDGQTECKAIGFNMTDDVLPEGRIDVAGKIQRNEFRGQVSYELRMEAVRPSGGDCIL